MKTINLLKMTVGIVVLGLTISCSKDKKIDNGSKDSRNVKYEITGNATGTFDATYTTGSGTGGNAVPLTLPWSREEVFQAGINFPIINAAVFGATPGKTITAKIYVGGVEKKSQPATVQPDGTAVIAGLTYTLK